MTKGKNVKRMTPRERRKHRIRKHVHGSDLRPRVSVFRSAKHTYAQLISDDCARTLASVSTLDQEVLDALDGLDVKEIYGGVKSRKSVAAAKAVGLVLAKRALEKNFQAVVFDRNGFLYTGRVQAVADGLREGGIAV